MNTSKLIRAVVGSGRYTETAAITKEDYGRVLKIEGIELPETYEIDFSNDRKEGTSVTMIGNADGVLIPQQFIKSGKDIYAFYYHVGTNFGKTTYIFHIPNRVRPDRTNEQPEPEQQSVIDQTIAALNDAVETTSQSASDAADSAAGAKRDADFLRDASATATTLPEGSEATATLTDGLFEFGIPKGDKGDKGDTGSQGVKGDTGERGPQGPKGDKGDKGDTGEVTQAEFDELSGEVTSVKGNLSDKAPIIQANVHNKYTVISSLGVIAEKAKSVSVTGLGIDRLIAFEGENLIPDMSGWTVSQAGDFDVSMSIDHLTVSGTYSKIIRFKPDGKNSIFAFDDPIEVGTIVNAGAIIKGTSNSYVANKCRVYFYFYDANGGSAKTVSSKLYEDTTWLKTFTTETQVAKMQLTVEGASGWNCDELEIYPFVFIGDKKIQANTTISYGEQYNLDASVVFGWNSITTTPYTHSIVYYADTKAYIDEHAPEDYISTSNIAKYIPAEYVKFSDLVYLSPEMFGAAGDGVQDDYEAFNACISASVLSDNHRRPIRAYGTYKISSGLEFTGRNNDVFVKRIIYTGNDAAVTLHGLQSSFVFGQIVATTGANAVGIRCATLDVASSYGSFCQSDVKCDRVFSNGNTLELINDTGLNNLYYNRFHFNAQRSENANIIYTRGGTNGENDIYGKYVTAHAGYLLYQETDEYGMSTALRLHEYSIEQDVTYGIHGAATLIGCRTVEFMNHIGEGGDNKRGVLFDFDGLNTVNNESYADSNTIVDYVSVDTANAKTYEDVLGDVKKALDAGKGITTAGMILGTNGIRPTFEAVSRYAPAGIVTGTQCFLTKGRLVVYYNHKAFIPNVDVYHSVSSDFRTFSQTNGYITPTYFVLASNANIYLDDSYCCVGINKIKVEQGSDKKAIVYDKNGDVLWDGTSLEAGVYCFECDFVPLEELIIVKTDGASVTIPKTYLANVYTGNNERWRVFKLT